MIFAPQMWYFSPVAGLPPPHTAAAAARLRQRAPPAPLSPLPALSPPSPALLLAKEPGRLRMEGLPPRGPGPASSLGPPLHPHCPHIIPTFQVGRQDQGGEGTPDSGCSGRADRNPRALRTGHPRRPPRAGLQVGPGPRARIEQQPQVKHLPLAHLWLPGTPQRGEKRRAPLSGRR